MFFSLIMIHDMYPNSVSWLHAIEQKSLDLKFRLRGSQAPKSKIIIVGGDEAAFQKFGQWPWDRGEVFSPLVRKICGYSPKAFGLDLVWSESEKTMSKRLQQELKKAIPGNALEDTLQSKSGDTLLASAIEDCGNKIVLGYTFLKNQDAGLPQAPYKERLKLLSERGQNMMSSMVRGKIAFPEYEGDRNANTLFGFNSKTGLLNIPQLVGKNTAQGFFNGESESDGNYRHAILAFHADSNFYPSLPLRMAQKANKADTPPTITLHPEIPERNQNELLQISLYTESGAQQSIPVDLQGRGTVNYRGPNYTFPNVSIAEVLSPSDTLEYTQKVPNGEVKKIRIYKSDFFKDAYVFLGITAIALYDIRPNPMDPQASGVENHANILDNLLSNDFLLAPTAETLFLVNIVTVILSILYGWTLIRFGAMWGLASTGVLAISILGFDFKYLFTQGIAFFSPVYAIQILTQYLAITVFKYKNEESEKKFIRSAFDKYVSPAIVDSMIKDPTKLKLGGDKKELSVMFTDIRSFTELAEKIDVKSLTQFLNEYLGSMTDVLQKNQGTLDKYIGDAVMGFWGAPVDNKDHAKCAVKTAVEMMQALEKLNQEFKAKYGFTVDIGIGINSGAVSVGNFGSSKVFEYTVIGDNVNLASRLEGLNKYFGTKILISETTHKLLSSGEFVTREVDTVRVKGKHTAVKVYEVVPDTAAFTALRSVLPTFNEALMLYYAKKFEKAASLFQQVLIKCPNDLMSEELLERCKRYSKAPPEGNWDGSSEMQAK